MTISSYPEIGQVVTVRQKKFVITDVQENILESSLLHDVLIQKMHLVHLSSIEDDDLGTELSIIWQIEPGGRILDVIAKQAFGGHPNG